MGIPDVCCRQGNSLDTVLETELEGVLETEELSELEEPENVSIDR